MARYNTVLLDADGTLLDFDATERQALRRTLEARGVEATPRVMAAYLDINRPLWAAHYRGELTRDALMVRRFAEFAALLGIRADAMEWNREYLHALGDCGDVLPGAVELLETLKPHCRLYLATNGVKDTQRRRLEGNPIAPLLDGVFISEEMGVGKPDKAYFDRIFAATHADPATTVMVGDDLNSDIQGAINAGIDSIWYSQEKEKSALPTYQVSELAGVAQIILEER